MSTVMRLRAWLAPPVFPTDKEQTRIAELLNAVLLADLGPDALSTYDVTQTCRRFGSGMVDDSRFRYSAAPRL